MAKEQTMEANDMAAMRKALKDILKDVDCAKVNKQCDIDYFLSSIEKCAKTALSKPPRQCDVGTAEEQNRRFERYCDSEVCKCKMCENVSKYLVKSSCALEWEQTPYVEENSDGEK